MNRRAALLLIAALAVCAALFPFGHGLSYTTFEYSNLKVEEPRVAAAAPGPAAVVQVGVKNTGERAGAEVVQVYFTLKTTATVAR
jgi:hypothetical protein